VFAGVCCALCHGVLRCSDVLHSEGLSLSEDAVMGTCWKMKKKAAPVPWAALRMGLSGRDWAAEWLSVLRSVDLPGGDFVTLGINASATDFVPRVARYYDVANAMRMLLTLPPINLSPEQALVFTPHSWRHFYNTAARQLDLGDQAATEIAHWEPGSKMPKTYDSKACVAELRHKSTIVGAFNKGWTLVDKGMVPRPVPVVVSCNTPPPKVDVSQEVRIVINAKSYLVHINKGVSVYSLCNLAHCGSPQSPVKPFIFASTTIVPARAVAIRCRRCFGPKYKHLLQDIGEEPEPRTSSASSSSALPVKATCASESEDSGSASQSSSSGAGSFEVVPPVPAVKGAEESYDAELEAAFATEL